MLRLLSTSFYRRQHEHLGAIIWSGSDRLPKLLFHADVVTGQK